MLTAQENIVLPLDLAGQRVDRDWLADLVQRVGLGDLDADGAVVTEVYAEAHDLEVGGPLAFQAPSGEGRSLVVRGIYDPPRLDSLLGDVAIGREAFDAAYPAPENILTFVDAEPGAGAALIGAALGLPLGIGLAALLTEALSEYDVALAIPVGMLAAFTLVAVAAGIAAAILPARRAARLNVLDALHYE